MDPTVIAATLTGLVIGIPIGRAFSVSALHRSRPATQEPPAPVAYDDPQRDPNYCWTHNMIWPACAGMH
jgi:hypothetical protein